MLVKKEMLTVPLLDCPKCNKSYYVATAQVVELPRSGKLLVADFYDAKSKKLDKRVFTDGKNALMCDEWPAEKWYLKTGYDILKPHASSSEQDDKKARKFFGKKSEEPLRSIVSGHLWEIGSERRDKRTTSKYAMQEGHFAMIPEYPANLADYCDEHVFDKTYIFMSKKKNGKRSAVCAFCRKRFKLSGDTRSGTLSNCPKCGKSAIYRGDWTGCTKPEKAKILIVSRANGALIMQWVNVERHLAPTPKSFYTFKDYYRTIEAPSKRGKVTYAYRWMNMGYAWGPYWYRKQNDVLCADSTHVYTENLAETYTKVYKNINLAEVLRSAGKVSLPCLLSNIDKYPVAEYLIKLGLIQLASTSAESVNKGRNFSEVLGVRGEYKSLYRKYNISWEEHRIIQSSKTWVSPAYFEKLRALDLVANGETLSIVSLMSFERFINYFTKQATVTGMARNAGRTIKWYADYLELCSTMNVDMSRKSVLFPENIKVAHDRLVESYNKVKLHLDDEKLKIATEKIYSGLKEHSNEKHCIVFPSSRSEFIAEGQALNHCVGMDRYFENHIKGEQMVFFVRKLENKEKPYFTLEVDMRTLKILQLYGFGDQSAKGEIRSFANEFIQKLRPIERSA